MTAIEPIWVPQDYLDAVAAVQAHDKHAALVAEMRAAAELLERISQHYNTDYHPPARHQKWSADGLRSEATYLELNP